MRNRRPRVRARARSPRNEGLQSALAGDLRVQEGRQKRPGARARDLLLQVLVLPQRVHQGHSQARGPVHPHQPPLRRASQRGQRKGQGAQRRPRHAKLPDRAERYRSERSHELPARGMLLELGLAAAEPTLHRTLKETAMTTRNGVRHAAWLAVLAVALVLFTAPAALAQSGHKLLGGPRGIVKSSKGDLLEGMMVQLIAQRTAIRTTVYTDVDGHYEFPKLDAGTYTLRIAQPRDYRPYVKEKLEIGGANELDEIVLTRITNGELLPHTPEIAAQMTGSEWLMSLDGTGEEKKLLTVNCNWCHSYQQIFRNKYDEKSWGHILERMTHGAGSPLILMRPDGRLRPEEEAKFAKWLARVRGPDSVDPPFVTLPRPRGEQTKVIITEYELPRLELATHDIWGDSKGGLWYSPHRSSYIGRLDPKTGAVKEFHVPPVPEGVLPGTHWIYVDKNDIVWGSENWAHNIWRLNPATGEFKRVVWKVKEPPNAPMGGNYAFDPDGFIWKARDRALSKVSSETGDTVLRYPTKKFPGTYGAAMSKDGRYYGGGAWPRDGVIVVDTKTGEVFEPDSSPNSE